MDLFGKKAAQENMLLRAQLDELNARLAHEELVSDLLRKNLNDAREKMSQQITPTLQPASADELTRLRKENRVLCEEANLLRERVDELLRENALLLQQLAASNTEPKTEEKSKPEPEPERNQVSESAAVPENSYIVLDLETTGLYPSSEEIIEIAAVKYMDGKEIDQFVSFINPGFPIPKQIMELTGIRDEDVNGAPSMRDILPDLSAFLGSFPLVAHNASFDLSFLETAFRRGSLDFDKQYYDTLDLARQAYPYLSSYRLEDLKHELNLGNLRSHRALTDVYMTAALFEKCQKRLGEISPALWKYASDRGKGKLIVSRRDRAAKKVSEFQPTVEYIDPNGALFGKVVVFTGALSMSRTEAMQMAVNAGAIVKGGISRKVDYLVVGEQDVAIVGTDGMSDKEEKAHSYNDEGRANIKFIDEAEFLRLVHG